MRNYLCACLLVIALFASCSPSDSKMESPSGKLVTSLHTDDNGILRYSVQLYGKTILEPSALGLMCQNADFSHLKIVKTGDKRELKYTYDTPSGKSLHNTFTANEWDVEVENPKGEKMVITFHLSNNGLAFRYNFDEERAVSKENTSFKLPISAKAWLNPYLGKEYEIDISVGTKAPNKEGWSYPALFLSNETWVLISEAGLEPTYCGTHLAQDCANGEYFVSLVDAANKPISRSPWRVIMLGASKDIVENTMITDLAEPNKIGNIDFVQPGTSLYKWDMGNEVLLDKEARCKEFDRLSKMGVKGVDLSFTPSDAPQSIQLYYDILKDAATYKLLVNLRNATVSRGWERTYPNLLGMSANGLLDQLDGHRDRQLCTILPFTLNVIGGVDFTPMFVHEKSAIDRSTSNGFELALTTLLQSGTRNFDEGSACVISQPDYVQAYLKDLPKVWDEIRLVDGYPGKYIVLARRSGSKWYVAGINAEDEELNLTLDFSYYYMSTKGTLITDGDSPQKFTLQNVEMFSTSTIKADVKSDVKKINVAIQPHGGFVAVFDVVLPY